MKINFRLHKKHTSITLRNDLVGLWLLMNDHDEKQDDAEHIAEEKVLSFVHDCLESWPLNVARGFSEHVYDKMYADILERKDYLKYKRIVEAL